MERSEAVLFRESLAWPDTAEERVRATLADYAMVLWTKRGHLANSET